MIMYRLVRKGGAHLCIVHV